MALAQVNTASVQSVGVECHKRWHGGAFMTKHGFMLADRVHATDIVAYQPLGAAALLDASLCADMEWWAGNIMRINDGQLRIHARNSSFECSKIKARVLMPSNRLEIRFMYTEGSPSTELRQSAAHLLWNMYTEDHAEARRSVLEHPYLFGNRRHQMQMLSRAVQAQPPHQQDAFVAAMQPGHRSMIRWLNKQITSFRSWGASQAGLWDLAASASRSTRPMDVLYDLFVSRDVGTPCACMQPDGRPCGGRTCSQTDGEYRINMCQECRGRTLFPGHVSVSTPLSMAWVSAWRGASTAEIAQHPETVPAAKQWLEQATGAMSLTDSDTGHTLLLIHRHTIPDFYSFARMFESNVAKAVVIDPAKGTHARYTIVRIDVKAVENVPLAVLLQ